MQFTITIPDHLVNLLRETLGDDLNRAVLEHFVVDGYRTGKLSRFQVQSILEFENRWDTENWLGDRGVNVSYSIEDLRADRCTLERIMGE